MNDIENSVSALSGNQKDCMLQKMFFVTDKDKKQNEHVEFMPFDINHDTITIFETEKDLKGMGTWIRNIINEVDKDRAKVIPEYSALLLFNNNGELSEEVAVTPTFLRRIYVRKIISKNIFRICKN